MEQKNQDQGVRIAVDFENFRSEFADFVQVQTTTDHVYLNFIETLPGVPEEQPNAKIVSRIVLTWPHFARLANLLPKLFEENKHLAKDSFDTNVYQGENE